VGIRFQQSFTAIIEHLVIGHGYRRLLSWEAFGAPRQLDQRASVQRYPAFPPGILPRLSTETSEYGDFSESSGMDAIRRLLSGFPMTRSSAANDNMALGAMKSP